MSAVAYDDGRRPVAGQLERNPDGLPIYRVTGRCLSDYLESRKMVSVIQGPIRSGKSKVSNLKVAAISGEQWPGPDSVRRTRWGVIRNTYAELTTTTMRTWTDTFPEDLYGKIIWSKPAFQEIRYNDIAMEIDFLALDKPDDVKKLRSGEYTGFYINELQYIPKELFDECTSRAGAYPARKDGGARWYGVIADMNAPDEDHFTAMMTGQADYPEGTPDERKIGWPKDWDFIRQPSALLEKFAPDGRTVVGYEPNPEAENIEWLTGGFDFYLKQIAGKGKDFIDSRVMNRVTFVVEGSPVWPMFRTEVHVASENLAPVLGREVVIGLDFGRNPAAIFMQAVNNRVYVQFELQGANEAAVFFAPRVKRFLEQHYPGCPFRAFGDPKGRDKGQANDQTAYEVFANNGIPVSPAPGLKQNSIKERVEAVAHLLMDATGGAMGGQMRAVFSPACRSLRLGMLGKYHLRKDETGDLAPFKNRYADLCDALQYGVLGLGEGRRMIGLSPTVSAKPVQVWKRRPDLRRGRG